MSSANRLSKNIHRVSLTSRCNTRGNTRPPHIKTPTMPYQRTGRLYGFIWSGRRDLNPRRQPWQGCTLPLSYSRKRRLFYPNSFLMSTR